VQVDGVAVGLLEGGGEVEELVLHDRATAPDKERRAASRYKVCDMYVCVYQYTGMYACIFALVCCSVYVYSRMYIYTHTHPNTHAPPVDTRCVTYLCVYVHIHTLQPTRANMHGYMPVYGYTHIYMSHTLSIQSV